MSKVFVELLRTIVVITTMSYVSAFADDEFSELGTNALFDIVKAVAPHASALRTALDKVNENVARSLPSSMMDQAALKQLEEDTIKLNKLVPKPLPSLNNKDALERIARGSKNSGTLTGASVELQRLERAGRVRGAEIERLRLLRNNLTGLRSKYQDTAEAARKISDKIGKLASNPTVEFIGRLTGKSVALSWADFETEFVPTLQKRQEAAERAIARLDDVTSRSEADLRNFNESRMFANEIFTQTTGLNASAVPGTSAVRLDELGRTMQTDTDETMKLSEKMRKEASEIRQWNAGISKFQSMLNWISLGLTGSSTQATDGTSKTQNTTINIKTTILIRNGDSWELKPRNSTGPELKRP